MGFKEFKASLRLNKITKSVLLRIVAILFPSASSAAQKKAVKLAQNAITRKVRKITGKRKGKRKSKSKKRKGNGISKSIFFILITPLLIQIVQTFA